MAEIIVKLLNDERKINFKVMRVEIVLGFCGQDPTHDGDGLEINLLSTEYLLDRS